MELEFIDWLRSRLPSHPALKLGVGDDAAVLALAKKADHVVTVDVVTDLVDFEVGRTDPQLIGRKSLAVNLSDLAAMAARPIAAVVGIVLPRDGLELAKEIYEGMLPLADEFGLVIAGGDTNSWAGRLVISITAIGEVTGSGPLKRSGARPGDHLLVTGELGGSILGRHLTFTPRVSEALTLHRDYELRAGMDISDGLALDLSRLAKASGCGADVELPDVPIAADAQRLADLEGGTPLEHAMSDGEDFELLLAASPLEAKRLIADQPLDVPITHIGRFVTESGIWGVDEAGRRKPLKSKGFTH